MTKTSLHVRGALHSRQHPDAPFFHEAKRKREKNGKIALFIGENLFSAFSKKALFIEENDSRYRGRNLNSDNALRYERSPLRYGNSSLR